MSDGNNNPVIYRRASSEATQAVALWVAGNFGHKLSDIDHFQANGAVIKLADLILSIMSNVFNEYIDRCSQLNKQRYPWAKHCIGDSRSQKNGGGK